jgi:hypothetical protein
VRLEIEEIRRVKSGRAGRKDVFHEFSSNYTINTLPRIHLNGLKI